MFFSLCCHAATKNNVKYSLPTKIAVDMGSFINIEESLRCAKRFDWSTVDDKKKAIFTSAFLAGEIKNHLLSIGQDLSIVDIKSAIEDKIPAIYLLPTSAHVKLSGIFPEVESDMSKIDDEGFVLCYNQGNVYICSNSRSGMLYGGYRFLKELGFRWFDSSETLRPPSIKTINLPSKLLAYPNVRYRGFWTWGNISDDYLVWMARNGLNLIGGNTTLWLRHLLCMKVWRGGHRLIQRAFSDPELFQKHPDWFCLVNGKRRSIPAKGSYWNPVFGNPDVAQHFSKFLLRELKTGELVGCDLINIWPNDSRGGHFDQSNLSKSIGNETDNLMLFYLRVCKHLKEAKNNGHLDAVPTICGISYYLTWRLPSVVEYPKQLMNEKYIHVMYMNERSFAAGMEKTSTSDTHINSVISKKLNEWGTLGMHQGVVEYYNYSGYGGIGFVGQETFFSDWECYNSLLPKLNLAAYMHPLMCNPGPLRLTNQMLAASTWLLSNDVRQDFFEKRYGPLAERWQAFWRKMSKSVENVKEMFGQNSLKWCLCQHLYWKFPPYSRADCRKLVKTYLDGGDISLPNKFSSGKAVIFVNDGNSNIKTKFSGLNSSVELQQEILIQALNFIEESPDSVWKQRCLDDLDWFKLCSLRYQLSQATAVARAKNQDNRGIDELAAQLEKLALLMGIVTVSPQIDQKNLMLKTYRANLMYWNRKD